jgi:hypothetical protein
MGSHKPVPALESDDSLKPPFIIFESLHIYHAARLGKNQKHFERKISIRGSRDYLSKR